jgi:hypothetical protein
VGLETDIAIGLATQLSLVARDNVVQMCPFLKFEDMVEARGQTIVTFRKHDGHTVWFNDSQALGCSALGIPAGQSGAYARRSWAEPENSPIFRIGIKAFALTRPERVEETDDKLICYMPREMRLPSGWQQGDRRKHVERVRKEREAKLGKTITDPLKALPEATLETFEQIAAGSIPDPVDPPEKQQVSYSLDIQLKGVPLPLLVRALNQYKRNDPYGLTFSVDNTEGTLIVTRHEVIS